MGSERPAAGQQRRHIRGGAHLRGDHARDREHGPGNADPDTESNWFWQVQEQNFLKVQGKLNPPDRWIVIFQTQSQCVFILSLSLADLVSGEIWIYVYEKIFWNIYFFCQFVETLNAGVWLHIKIIFPFQVRTSYVPGEILWGYRFEHKCVSYDKGHSQMTPQKCT